MGQGRIKTGNQKEKETLQKSKKFYARTRLVELQKGLQEVIEAHQPGEAAVEETFVNKNPVSTLKLGMARGVILWVPAAANLPVAEYATHQIKKSIVGVGHADKNQVAMMVQRILPTCGAVHADAADALATAICHAHFRHSNQVWERRAL